MSITKKDVESFFAKYEAGFNAALGGHVDLKAIKALYSDQFIAASPRGVRAGTNDGSFDAAMSKGYQRYRDLGTKSMKVESIETHEVDDCHLMARVRWQSVYEKPGTGAIHIPFDVNYLLEHRENEIKVFAWITGDEEALLKAHGVM